MKRAILLLLMAAPLYASANFTCTNNSGSDPGGIQSAVNSGGTVTLSGTCNMGSSSITISNAVSIVGSGSNGNSGVGANTNTTINGTGVINVYSDNVTITGITHSGVQYVAGGAVNTQRNNFSFDHDTFQNYTAFPMVAAIGVSPIWRNSHVRNCSFVNFWPRGFNTSIPITQIQTWDKDGSTQTGAVFGSGGLDNTQLEYNSFNQIYSDGIHSTGNGLSSNTGGYSASGVSVSYNTFSLVHRMGIEFQGATGSCIGGCNWIDTYPGAKIAGNFHHTPAYPGDSGLNTYAISFAVNSQQFQLINNSAIFDIGTMATTGSPAGNAVEGAPGWPCTYNGANGGPMCNWYGTYQGNVISGDKPSNSDRSWGEAFANYESPVNPDLHQNNLMCGPPYNTDNSSSHANEVFRYNYTASTCPNGGGAAQYASTLSANPPAWTSANNQSFPTGGNGTFSMYVPAVTLPMRYVNFYLDGSTTPAVTQELQDLNSNFSADRKWLYHAQINTSSLSAGTHTIKATVTDVSGATSSVSQGFTVGSASGPSAVLSTNTLGWPITGTQTVTLSNGGNASLSLTGNSISGTNAGDFSYTTTCGSTLAAGANCSYTVSYAPTGAPGAAESALLSIANNSATNPVTVQLSGNVPLYTLASVPSGGTTAPQSSTLQPSAGITLSAWVNGSTQTNYPAFLSYGQDSASPYESYALQAPTIDGNNGPDFYLLTGTGSAQHVFSSAKLSAGTQYLVTGTYDGTTLSIYVNGVLQNTLTASLPGNLYYYGTNGLGVGRKYSATSNGFTGTESGANIWGTALTAAQVSYLYAQGPPSVIPPGPGIINCSPSNCLAGPGQSVQLTASSSVTWSLLSGSVGTLSNTTGNTTTYTAPSALDEAKAKLGGCMILPNDSIFNTRIDNLPVSSSSANWISAFGSYAFGFVTFTDLNVIDNNTNTLTNPLFYYTAYYNGKPFQIPDSPTMLRELGSMSGEGGQDHHLISVNHQTCQIYETYQDKDAIQGINRGQDTVKYGNGCNQGQGLSGTCDANSAASYNGLSNAMVPTNTTTAGNLPIAPTTMRSDEIRAGAVNHALRFTTNNGECGAGGLWPAIPGTSGSCGGANAIPAGGRLRMKASATCPGSSAAALAICTALKRYGMLWDDTTSGSYPQITLGQSMFFDPQTLAALSGLYFDPSLFEGVDESSLMLSTNSYAVKPNNGYVTPSNSAIVSANGTYVSIALQPVTVGVQDHYVAMLASTTWTPTVYINGTSNTAFTITPTGGGTASGMSYTAPTLAPGGSASVDLKICAAADANACDHIYVNVVPGTCKSADQTVRVCIDSGATSSYGPDANGDSWAPDTVVTGGTYGSVNTTYFWDQQTDGKLFETWLSNSGDIDYKFVGVPAGQYKVTVGQGIGGNYGAGGPPCESYVAWPSTYGPISLDPYHIGSGPLYISSQGTITYQQYDPGLPPTNNGYQCYQRSFITLPATVGADGNLTLGFAALGNEKQTGAYQWLTSISTLKIETDSTLPYIQPWLNGVSDVVYARGTVQLSPVFWYLPQSTVTYSILSGPGTVNSTGLYTAPSTKPSVTTPVVIQLADQYGNAATQTLWLQGTAAVGFIY